MSAGLKNSCFDVSKQIAKRWKNMWQMMEDRNAAGTIQIWGIVFLGKMTNLVENAPISALSNAKEGFANKFPSITMNVIACVRKKEPD